MTEWLHEVARLETARDDAAAARRASDRETLDATRRWIRGQIEPAMQRFAAELRTIGRVVDVESRETSVRVRVRTADGLLTEYAALVGTQSESSPLVRDEFPTMSPVFFGVDRRQVRGERVYELLKLSYLGKLQSLVA